MLQIQRNKQIERHNYVADSENKEGDEKMILTKRQQSSTESSSDSMQSREGKRLKLRIKKSDSKETEKTIIKKNNREIGQYGRS